MLVITVPKLSDAEYILSKVSYTEWESTNYKTFSCTWCDCEFILLITGYGKVNIGSALQSVYMCSDIDGVVQIGTAGSIVGKCNIFDIFLVDKSLQYDVDFTKLCYNAGTLPGEAAGIFSSNIYLKRCAIKSICDADKKYIEGIMATGETFVANSSLIKCIRSTFCADAVDTECGAVGEFCTNNQIPFIGIKVISNLANENAVSQYNLYNEEANINSQKIALNFIKNFEY